MTRVIQHGELAHHINIDFRDYWIAKQWCAELWGPQWHPGDNRTGVWSMWWAGVTTPHQYRFNFAHERDKMWFILRWSGS